VNRSLRANRRLASLIRNQVLWMRVARRWLRRPVAWVTSGAPVEVLLAHGIIPFYPENHAAICAARNLSRDLAAHTSEAGWSGDLCSYFRVDLASQETGRTPLGTLTPPDLVLVCNNICGTVQNWFRVTAERYRVPFLFLDTPYSEGPPAPADVEYVRAQLEEIARDAARIAGRRYDERRVLAVARRSMEAIRLWTEVLHTARHRPAPFTSFDAFVQMAPIVSLRGTRRAVRYYRRLLDELRDRIANGIAAIEPEQARVVWDNIAIWPVHRALKALFAQERVALVADTYTGAWSVSRIVDETDPIGGLAQAYCDILLNHGAEHRVQVLSRLVTDFNASGFILHSNRSCKRFSLGQYRVSREVSQRTGAAGVVIEADMADPGFVDFEHLKSRLAPFFEIVKARQDG